MNLLDIVGRVPKPEPWAEGDNIPWNEPGFSARMLKEHLSQSHDLASRRNETIDRQVAWIASEVVGTPPARILDLGCGPGLYLQRLAALGHTCRGIDFSPASIAHARAQAGAAGLSIAYEKADIRRVELAAGGPYDTVMLIFGELNVFSPADARHILSGVAAALRPGGRLVLEPATEATVRATGNEAPGWWTAPSGLFGDEPHLMLTESFWDEAGRTATRRYYRIDAATGTVTRWASTQRAYSPEEYAALLEACGFGRMRFYPALAGETPDAYCAIVAERL